MHAPPSYTTPIVQSQTPQTGTYKMPFDDTSQLPLYQGDNPDKGDYVADIHSDMAENSDVAYHTWGIFTIAYPSRHGLPSLPDLNAYHGPIRAAYRLLNDLWRLDWQGTFLLMFCGLCTVLAPAFSLSFIHRITSHVAQLTSHQVIEDHVIKDLQKTVVNWILLASVLCGLEVVMSQAKIRARSCLRAHFIPQLVKARLSRESNEDDINFPYPHDYGVFVPAWEFIEALSARLKNILTITANAVTIVVIVWQSQSSEVVLRYALMSIFLLIIFTPMDATRGKGYTFWTNNVHYNRLMALFHIIFDPNYRMNVVRDGLAGVLCQEYQQESDQLGAAGPDVWIVGCGTLPAWYWSLINGLVTNYPLALYSFFALHFTRSLDLGSIVVFQYSLSTMHKSIELQFAMNSSFFDNMCCIQQFYNILDVPTLKAHDKIAYPNKPRTHANGMKISTRGLCLNANNVVDLDIEPGEMAVITGGNGSGKASLVKVLSGISKPSKGQVFIDGEIISNYDPTQLNRSIVFLGQYETVYPVSIKENITMDFLDAQASDERIHDALGGAGASEIVERLGFNTVLNPCSINAYSLNTQPGPTAVEVLRKYSPTTETELPDGERQRLIVARALYKATNGETVKLVIIDRATSALDDDSEFEIMMQFRKVARERGQTLIIVAHRLAERVRESADLIFYLKDGKGVASGGC